MSRKKKYTPGPWSVKENTEVINDYDVCDKDGYLILLGGTASTDERQLADVTLAAAAPELLEALERLVEATKLQKRLSGEQLMLLGISMATIEKAYGEKV